VVVGAWVSAGEGVGVGACVGSDVDVGVGASVVSGCIVGVGTGVWLRAGKTVTAATIRRDISKVRA